MNAAALLLLPSLLAAAPQLRALEVDLHFVCREHTTERLIVAPGAEVALTVPPSCPDAGSAWTLALRCEGKAACAGRVAGEDGVPLARVSGTRRALAVTPVGDKAPKALGHVALEVKGEVRMAAPDILGAPLAVALETQGYGVRTRAASGEITRFVRTRPDGEQLLLVQARRLDARRARVRVWNAAQGQVLDRTLTLGQGVDVPCDRLFGWCEGPLVRVSVDESRRGGPLAR